MGIMVIDGWCIIIGMPLALTIRTLPSASVISSSDTLDSETRSISVLSFLRSINSFHRKKLLAGTVWARGLDKQQDGHTAGLASFVT